MTVFEEKAPWIMSRLIPDFNLTKEDAAAIVGNIGHESMGFTKLQEMKPKVEGSRGGYGWPQWTGPRRRAYESYCTRNKIDPSSDNANYAYMFVELKGDYKNSIIKLKSAKTLYDKVVAFELQYEGAGIKHYSSRLDYAKKALNAYAESKYSKAQLESDIIKVEELPKEPVPIPSLEPLKTVDSSSAPAAKGFWSRFWSALARPRGSK